MVGGCDGGKVWLWEGVVVERCGGGRVWWEGVMVERCGGGRV